MKTIVIVILALVLIGGGYYWYSSKEAVQTPEEAEVSDENAASQQGKLNIDVVCRGALAYMSFPDGESAEKFVADCKAGDYPEVIDRYKAEMNLGDGAAI